MREAVWALLVAGLKPGEIRAKLAKGGVEGLPPLSVPESTMRDYVQRLRRHRGDPMTRVEPGAELQATRQILAALVQQVKREADRLFRAGVDRALTPEEMAQLSRLTRLAIDAEKRLVDLDRERKGQPLSTQDPAKNPRGGGNTRTALADLVSLATPKGGETEAV